MTESFKIRRRDLPSSLNYLAEQLMKAHDGLRDIPEEQQHHRVTILAVAITLEGIADQAQPAGACTGILTINIMGDTTRHPCRYPHGHTGAHEAQDTHGNIDRWTDGAPGASHIDAPFDQAPPQCGAVATFDPGKPCILPPGHPYPKHRDQDGRGFTTN